MTPADIRVATAAHADPAETNQLRDVSQLSHQYLSIKMTHASLGLRLNHRPRFANRQLATLSRHERWETDLGWARLLVVLSADPSFMIVSEATMRNSRAALLERRAAGVLTWSGPVLML